MVFYPIILGLRGKCHVRLGLRLGDRLGTSPTSMVIEWTWFGMSWSLGGGSWPSWPWKLWTSYQTQSIHPLPNLTWNDGHISCPYVDDFRRLSSHPLTFQTSHWWSFDHQVSTTANHWCPWIDFEGEGKLPGEHMLKNQRVWDIFLSGTQVQIIQKSLKNISQVFPIYFGKKCSKPPTRWKSNPEIQKQSPPLRPSIGCVNVKLDFLSWDFLVHLPVLGI
jgi:hypothetical protein